MTKTIHESVSEEKGFTLVELAIVMVIIGLLIGGILKGQEMINNAQVSATIAQMKGIDAATSTFRDMYDALPGDITNPGTRLVNCTAAPCNTAGNGNSVLTNAPGSVANENLSFWSHLNAADLLTGIDGSATTAWGFGVPATKVGGGLTVGYTANGALTNGYGTGRGGHWLMLQGVPGTAASTVLEPGQAARIDRKMDDGAPNTGSVISSGAAVGATSCSSAAGVYNEAANPDGACALSTRIQG